MLFTRGRRMGLSILLTFFFAAISTAQTSSGSSADSAAIQKSVASFSDAFNRHDPRACAARYVEDGDFTGLQGKLSHGRKELEEHYTSVFTTGLKTVRSSFELKSIRFLTPEIASVDIEWTANGSKAPDGSDLPTRKGLINWVMTRRGGQWLIAVYHESEFNLPASK